MSSTYSKLFVEGKKGRREEGELLTLGLRDREYLEFNLYDFLQDKIDLREKNLAKLQLGREENYRVYLHDGSESIKVEGSTTSNEGYYVWHNSDNEFKIFLQFSAQSSANFLITDYTLTNGVLTETTLG